MDQEAWLTISQELGHEREQVTTAYLGRQSCKYCYIFERKVYIILFQIV